MNNIHVYTNQNILTYPKCGIKTHAYIVKNGATNNKIEGDGKTPLGEFELGIILSMQKDITENMYWVDDSKSRYYNQLVDVTKVEKDWETAEHLIDYPIEYEYLVEIKTNPDNIPQKGSAIFLHCENNKPTAGCVAVNRNVMKQIIENIDDKTKIIIR
jgi:L,D-peptidoglycan transpeptidase YkuD (ErfK/YbiS/YcfS/YnhG family)